MFLTNTCFVLGRLYDIHGNMRNWWTNHSAEAFTNKAQCYIDEYDTFTISGNHVSRDSVFQDFYILF